MIQRRLEFLKAVRFGRHVLNELVWQASCEGLHSLGRIFSFIQILENIKTCDPASAGIYIYIYICIYWQIERETFPSLYTERHFPLSLYMFIFMYDTRVHIHVFVNAETNYVHIYIHIYTYVCRHTYLNIYTYIQYEYI